MEFKNWRVLLPIKKTYPLHNYMVSHRLETYFCLTTQQFYQLCCRLNSIFLILADSFGPKTRSFSFLCRWQIPVYVATNSHMLWLGLKAQGEHQEDNTAVPEQMCLHQSATDESLKRN